MQYFKNWQILSVDKANRMSNDDTNCFLFLSCSHFLPWIRLKEDKSKSNSAMEAEKKEACKLKWGALNMISVLRHYTGSDKNYANMLMLLFEKNQTIILFQ